MQPEVAVALTRPGRRNDTSRRGHKVGVAVKAGSSFEDSGSDVRLREGPGPGSDVDSDAVPMARRGGVGMPVARGAQGCYYELRCPRHGGRAQA